MLYTETLLFSFTIVCFSVLLLLQFKRLYPVSHRGILSLILLLFILTRFDDLLQVSGLVTYVPRLLFLGSVTFLMLGPLTYGYIIARTSSTARSLSNKHWLVHAAVMLPVVVYLIPYWWLQPEGYHLEMLQSDALNTPLNGLLWPSYGDLVLLFYLGLCIKRLRLFGISLKEWFSFVEDKNLAGLKNILQWLAVIIFSHLVWTWTTWFEVDIMQSLFSSLLIVAQQIFILALVLEAVANGMHSAGQVIPDKEKPTTAQYSNEQLVEAAELIQKVVATESLFLDADLTLARLSRILQLPQKRLSLAINQHLNKTFYDFINGLRVDYAKELIKQRPGLNLLDIAMQSGFNSKSVFNNAFKKYARTTPSEYRRLHKNS